MLWEGVGEGIYEVTIKVRGIFKHVVAASRQEDQTRSNLF
jgi:hypothetical protein